jgi:hypothetical protein
MDKETNLQRKIGCTLALASIPNWDLLSFSCLNLSYGRTTQGPRIELAISILSLLDS